MADNPTTALVSLDIGGRERVLRLSGNGLAIAEKHLDPGISLLIDAHLVLRHATIGTVRAILYGAVLHEQPGKTWKEKEASLSIDEVGEWITRENVVAASNAVIRAWRVSQGLTADHPP